MTVVVVLLVIMLMVLPVAFLAFVPVDGCHPRRRSYYLLKVKGFGVEQQVEIHVAIVAGDNGGLRLDVAQDRLDAAQFLFGDLAGLVEQDRIAKFYLLDHEAFEVVLLDVLLLQVASPGKLVAQAERIHYRYHTIEFGHAFLRQVGVDLRVGADGLCDGSRLADAAGLDDDIVETVRLD